MDRALWSIGISSLWTSSQASRHSSNKWGCSTYPILTQATRYVYICLIHPSTTEWFIINWDGKPSRHNVTHCTESPGITDECMDVYAKYRVLWVCCYIQAHSETVMKVNLDKEITTITPKQQVAIQSLWADPGVQECFERRREFQISDSAKLYDLPLCLHCKH